MADAALRDRLVTRSVAAPYALFLGLGAVLTVVGLVLFALNATGPNAPVNATLRRPLFAIRVANSLRI